MTLPGTGASADGDLPAASVEDEAAALAAVVEAAGAGPVELFAGSSGAPIGSPTRPPTRSGCERLLLYGGYASGSGIADARSRRAIVEPGARALGPRLPRPRRRLHPRAPIRGEREAFVDFQRRGGERRAGGPLARGRLPLRRRRPPRPGARRAPSSAPPRRPRDPLRARPRTGRGRSPTRPSSPSTATITSPGSAIRPAPARRLRRARRSTRRRRRRRETRPRATGAQAADATTRPTRRA